MRSGVGGAVTTVRKLVVFGGVAAAIALAPGAHATGEQFYLSCLRQHGLNVNDEKQALEIGNAIEHNATNGVDPGQTLNDLMHRFGQDYTTADSEMVCAAQTMNTFQGPHG